MSNLGKLYSELSDANLTCIECGANHYGREYECLDCHIPGKLDKLRKQIQQIEDAQIESFIASEVADIMNY
ncbi:MAG: hypothetical protein E7283_01315 [Lachnospiraceae bacterium]|nr:hypothetical protein [Lachnospiraceae bacterium]